MNVIIKIIIKFYALLLSLSNYIIILIIIYCRRHQFHFHFNLIPASNRLYVIREWNASIRTHRSTTNIFLPLPLSPAVALYSKLVSYRVTHMCVICSFRLWLALENSSLLQVVPIIAVWFGSIWFSFSSFFHDKCSVVCKHI